MQAAHCYEHLIANNVTFVSAYAVDDLQMKELQDQLEAEQYFVVFCHVFIFLFVDFSNS